MSKNWSWNHFFSDGQFYQNNNSYKNAWCLACLNYQLGLLRESDVVSTALYGMGSGRTDLEREAQGSYYSFYYIL
jgi:hypothetical protein